MPVCLLGLGSNLGNRTQNLASAVQRLGAHPDVEVSSVSRFYATKPIGGPRGQGEFLNAAVRLNTSLSPNALMRRLLDVEKGLGRRRDHRWGARTVDVDILLYGQSTVDLPELKIPHPRMAFRRFVLEPAAEIASEMVHPEIGWPIGRLLEHLNTAIPYVALAGLPGAGKSKLAEVVADQTAARILRDPLAEMAGEGTANRENRNVQLHLELVDRRTRLLDRARLTGDNAGWISDFWFEQTSAYAESWLSDGEVVGYRTYCEAARREVATPKLLVLLEITPRQAMARLRESNAIEVMDLDEDRLAAVARQLEQFASVPGQHPVLRLAAASFPEMVDEVVAAVETMR